MPDAWWVWGMVLAIVAVAVTGLFWGRPVRWPGSETTAEPPEEQNAVSDLDVRVNQGFFREQDDGDKRK